MLRRWMKFQNVIFMWDLWERLLRQGLKLDGNLAVFKSFAWAITFYGKRIDYMEHIASHPPPSNPPMLHFTWSITFFYFWHRFFSSLEMHAFLHSPFSQRPVKYDKLVILFWLIHFRHIHYITNKINIIWNFVLQNYLGPRHILPSFTEECSIGQI